jgi:outer membrane protein assembly factor BamE (lipoprotein component of BamABCDE complex)
MILVSKLTSTWNLLLKTFNSILLVFCAYLLCATLYFNARFNPPFWEQAFFYSLFWWTDNTIWATDYTEKKFDSIKVGMTEQEVLAILGQPLQVISNNCDIKFGTMVWHYTSQQPFCCSIYGDSNHQRRSIEFSSTGIAIQKNSEFYID